MEPSIKGAMALVRLASGPLSPHLETYISSLIEKQYSVISVKTKAWHAAAFDAWLLDRNIPLKELANTHICSGKAKLATALEFFQNNRSDSFGVKPPLY